MASLFIKRFATTTNQVGPADLAWTKPQPGESAMAYIIRWCNVSIRVQHPISEKDVIDFIIKNISGKMKEWLSVANIHNYQEFIDIVSRLGHAKLDELAVSATRLKK